MYSTTKILSLAIFTAIIFSNIYSVNARDLISDTQSSIPSNQNVTSNRIFKKINSIKVSFTEKTPLKLFKNGDTILDSYQSFIESGVIIEEKDNEFKNIIESNKQNIILNIPVANNRYIKLKLQKTNIYTENFVHHNSISNEEKILFYRGIVDKKPNSSAAVTITTNSISGLIFDEYGNYTISQLPEYPGKYLLYNENALCLDIPFSGCGTDDSLYKNEIRTSKIKQDIKHTKRDIDDCVEIYIEGDYSLYESHNNDTDKVVNYISALFNNVALLYFNEGIKILISDIYVWTTPDPYRNFTNSYDALDAFGGYVKDNYNGRLAHLLTSRNLGEGGRSWVDVLCDTHYNFTSDIDSDGIIEIRSAGPYGVSTVISNAVTPINTYSWDVFILSHQLGHNFGSPHTHACKWGPNGDEALDNCWYTEDDCGEGPEPVNGGTIMSYCNTGYAYYAYGINFSNGFGLEPGNLIRQKVIDANCLNECPINGTNLPVYPGDLNLDGIVNNQDDVLLFLYYDYDGNSIPREEQGILWQAYTCPDWGFAVPEANGNDIKHFDCDGNGDINIQDKNAIILNWGETHDEASFPGAGIYTFGNFPSNNKIYLQPSGDITDDLLIMDISSANVVFNGSWLGFPNVNLNMDYKDFPAQQKVEIGFSRTDGTNTIGSGIIGQIAFTLDNTNLRQNDNTQNTQILEFDAINVGAHNNAGNPIAISNQYQPVNIGEATPFQNLYKSNNTITTDNLIIIGQNQKVQYNANRVRLNEGFSVRAGADFKIRSSGCN